MGRSKARLKFMFFQLFAFCFYCGISRAQGNRTDTFMERLLQEYPLRFNHILTHRNALKVQIIYTEINRNRKNIPVFKDYYFNFNPNQYFYPASVVKMPVALLAMEKIRKLNKNGVTHSSSMVTEAAYSGQTPVYNDPTAADGRPTIEHYIKKIFLVSDNDAYNRLYEFLGQEYINQRLHEMGHTNAGIQHRLSIVMSEDQNRHTNPVSFYDTDGKILYKQPLQFNQQPYLLRKDSIGKAYYSGNRLINQPMDFSRKNKLNLNDMHNILKSILFPESVRKEQRFKINKEDYAFVWKYMSQYPAETNYPLYNSASYWDAYCKFIYWGSENKPLPKTFRIFNKVGDAYGFLTDVAYVVDFENKVEFIVSATIYCNSDETLNDDTYDYETIGFPFMKNLGQVLYQYELKRKRKNMPDLQQFRLKYDR